MADLDDDAVIVTIPAEEGGATITKIEDGGTKTAADDPISDLKGQFETLKGTLAAKDQQLAGAQQQLAARDQEIATARGQVAESQIDTVTSGLAAAEAEAVAAERDYVAAAEAGDFAAQAKAQRKMAGAETRIQRLQEAKADLEDAKPSKTTQRAEPSQQPRQTAQDPVEAVAANMAPRAAAWIRSHPDHITDKSKNAKMMATHFAALADGIEEGGDDYFSRLDAMASGGSVTKKPDPKPAVQIRPSAPTAPGGNSGGGMNGGGETVKLSAREVAAATDGTVCWNYDSPDGKFKKGDPVGLAEFAKRKSIMKKQGLYDRSLQE